ncbi:glycogen(starch) synthase [Puccinia graminis f. sp. tritici]|uniref:Glycogen(Starch) synthase n=1 Tax=Puccinia graminis f. sp. tritici TaxID=56615 RepID=A0A5B0M9Z8_PUCGR|nr:glycogen(starch) synthase [Puccinia graminis f. sp. tritici]
MGGLHVNQEESLLVGGTTSPAEEGILLVGEVVQPRRPGGHPPGRRGCTTSPARRESSWSTRLYNLVDQEDSLLVGEAVPPRRTASEYPYCVIDETGEVALRADAWVTGTSGSLYLFSPEPFRDNSEYAKRISAANREARSTRLYNLVDQEDSLLAGEAVQPRRPGGSPPGRRGCTTSPTWRESFRPARLYSLADQEGVLLVDEVVQPRRLGLRS